MEATRRVLDYMAYDRSLVNDEFAELRYRASAREGVQESYAANFPPHDVRLGLRSWRSALASGVGSCSWLLYRIQGHCLLVGR